MNSFKIQGTLIRKSDVIRKSDSFQLSIFAIETEGRYPQKIKFQMTQQRADLILPYVIGQEIIVHFDIRGNEHEDKIFNNLDAWKVEPVGGYQPTIKKVNWEDTHHTNVSAGEPASQETESHDNETMEDLPF